MQANAATMLHDKLRWARLQRAWTLDQAAKELGVSPMSISAWERGEIRPRSKYWKAICDVFGLRMEDFLPPSRPPQKTPVKRQSDTDLLVQPRADDMLDDLTLQDYRDLREAMKEAEEALSPWPETQERLTDLQSKETSMQLVVMIGFMIVIALLQYKQGKLRPEEFHSKAERALERAA